MFSPVNEYSLISGLITDKLPGDRVPNFMTFVMSKDFDPSEQYDIAKSYLYDEMSNKLFNKTLKALEQDNEKDYQLYDFNRQTFQNENYSYILNLVTIILKKTILLEYGYLIKDLFISVIKINKPIWYLNTFVCVHKPGCAYGKIVQIVFFHNKDNKRNKITTCELYGIVQEQNISKVQGIKDDNYYFVT